MSDATELKALADAVVEAAAELAERNRAIPEYENEVRKANDRLNQGRTHAQAAEKALEKARAALDEGLDR